ncbi:hypothetical protein BV20DRAFT_360357 [Pilatotrama ljubarskyi]|nr:hypothetical protein BV20DRAFT_360357 [Pilatotrama ljubarskyi]
MFSWTCPTRRRAQNRHSTYLEAVSDSRAVIDPLVHSPALSSQSRSWQGDIFADPDNEMLTAFHVLARHHVMRSPLKARSFLARGIFLFVRHPSSTVLWLVCCHLAAAATPHSTYNIGTSCSNVLLKAESGFAPPSSTLRKPACIRGPTICHRRDGRLQIIHDLQRRPASPRLSWAADGTIVHDVFVRVPWQLS